MKRRVVATLLGLFVVGFAGTALAGPITIIDNFTDLFPGETFWTNCTSGGCTTSYTAFGLEVGNLRLSSSGSVTLRNQESQTQTGLAGVLGGTRTGILDRVANPSMAVSSVTSGYIGLEYSQGAGARSNLTLQYGYQSPLNQDFSTFGPAGYFVLAGWSLDVGTVTATLTLTSGVTTQSTAITLGPALYEDPATIKIPFSAFGSIDFSDVDRIQLQLVNNGNSQDSSLTSFYASVPDGGASAALLGIGILAVAWARRRIG